MPPHEVYIEPFLGAGAILRLKRPASTNIGIDIDPEVIRYWKAAASRKTGMQASSVRNDGRRRRDPAKTARPAISPDSAETAASGDRRQYLELASLEMPAGPGEFKFVCHDSLEVLRSKVWQPNTLIYCDPPYLRSTRTHGAQYVFEMTDAQHIELIALLRELPCKVMLSGYSSALYAKALKGWNATAFQATTRGKPAAEWLWYNFDRPVELHDYRFLGEDFRERERIKRKKKRWIGKLERMPLLERQALLSAIAETAENSEAGSAVSFGSTRQR